MSGFVRRLRGIYLLGLLLFVALAAFVRIVIFVSNHPTLQGEPQLRLGLLSILALFVLVVIALGSTLWMWSDRVSLDRDSNVRIRRIFEAMNHLQDALVAVDHQGRLLGCNLRGRNLAARDYHSGMFLHEFFDFLDIDHTTSLGETKTPKEIVVHVGAEKEHIILRIRSFPAEKMNIIILSDITRQQEEAARVEEESERELIGRIAQGVAHDFNNILCAISGHAALMGRSNGLDGLQQTSLETITKEAGRGAMLAQQLVDLSRRSSEDEPIAKLSETILRASTILKRALPDNWSVKVDLPDQLGFPSMPVNQLEQLFIRFGLQLADEYEDGGILHLIAQEVGDGHLADVDSAYGAVGLLMCARDDEVLDPANYEIDPRPPLSRDGGGVVQSVVLSILERYGGTMDVLVQPNGHHGYRICLPYYSKDIDDANAGGILPSSLNHWRVLLAQPATERQEETAILIRGLGCEIDLTNNIVGVYSKSKRSNQYQALLLSASLLGMDPVATLRKLVRLDPRMAIILIGEPEQIPSEMEEEVGIVSGPITISALRLGILGGQRAAEIRKATRVYSQGDA